MSNLDKMQHGYTLILFVDTVKFFVWLNITWADFAMGGNGCKGHAKHLISKVARQILLSETPCVNVISEFYNTYVKSVALNSV